MLTRSRWHRNPSLRLTLPIEEPTTRTTSVDVGNANPRGHVVTAAQTEHMRDADYLFNARFASLRLLSVWFPQIDPTHSRAQTFRIWHSRRDVVLFTCSIVATIVLIINFVTTLVFKYKWAGDILFSGNCATASRLSSVLHVAINVLSTLLLGASNLCMQLLASPTRREVEKAHGQGHWVDIGVPSLHNLRHIQKRRQLVWTLLTLASLPLHFL